MLRLERRCRGYNYPAGWELTSRRYTQAGRAEAAREIAEAGDDLGMGEFGNAGDTELIW